nr:MAG TPA: tail tape measure protein [Caudoviricetes sp.]
MAKNKTEAIITLNGQQPLQVLKQLQEAAAGISDQLDAAQAKLKTLKPNTDPYKALVATINDLKKQYDLLASAQIKDISANERLQSVVDQLSNTSLRNLRRALGDGKRQLEGLSEAELEQANSIRAMMKTVGDQIRLLEGKYVKIREGLASIGTQSDQWLSKAIAQQKDLMDYTRRGTKEYKEQEQVMQMLTAEQNKRNAAISAEATAKRQAQFKQQVASSRQMLSSTDTMKNHSQTEIQTAINTLKQAQGQSNIGGSEWKQYADEIAKAEERLAALVGKVKEVKQVMSEKDAKDTITFMDSHTEGEVREAINTLRLLQAQTHIGSEEWKKYAISIADAEESLAKLTGKAKEVKEELSLTETNERMKTLGQQSEQSLQDMLRVLQEAKGSMEPFSKEWEDLAAKIENVKTRMAEVATNSPFERNYETAQKMARQDGLLDKEGYLRSPTKNDLEWSKSYLQKELGNTSPLETIKIAEIKEALDMLDERLSVFKDNADKSAMSAEKLNEVLSNMKTASLDDLKAASAELNKQLGKLAPSSDAAKQVRQQLQALDKEIKQVEDDVVDVNDVIARSKKGKASIEELKKAYQQLQAELNKINTGDEEFKNKQKALKDLKKEIDDVTGAAKKQGGAWSTAFRNLTAYVGLFGVFNQIKSLLTGVIRKNFEYSGSLTDIRKVAGLANEDINELSKSLAKIETRTSTEGLAKIAYEGAKLGMSKYGVEGMSGFVRAADQINVAIGEEMGEEALPALSKMVEVMGLIPKMGIEKSLLSTGSAMFKLATSSTATSNDITEFAKRCTGVARTAGITTDQLLALGSAFSSQMASPEVAATAMSKFIVALQKNHNIIEKDLDIPAGTINRMYSAGQAMDAIVLILEKMKAKGNMNALGEIFKDVGGDGQRLISSMVTMAKNVDMLKEHLDVSSEAFREGTAVSSEYEMQQQSAIGTLERANNLWEKAFVNPDGVDNVKSLAQAWYDVSKFLTENKAAMLAFNAILQVIIWSCQTLAYILPGLLTGLLFKGASAAIQAIGRAFAGVSETAIIATLRTEGLNAAWKKLNTSMKANWISLIIGLLVELGVTLYEVFKKTEDVANAQLDVNKYVEEGASKWEQERRKIDSYVAAISSANTNAKERARLIKNFNKDYKPYLDKLGLEVNSVNTLKAAYSKLNEEIKKKMFYEIRQKAFDTELGKVQGKVGKATLAYSKYINSERGSTWYAYDTKYLQDEVSRGRNAKQIYRRMVEGVYGKSGRWSDYNGDYILGTGSVNDKALQTYISNFVNAQKEYDTTRNTIKKALDPLVGDYDSFAGEDVGTLSNNAPDKDAISAAKREAREHKQALREQQRSWRDELKQKQDEASAIMDNVRNFYERQINEKLSQAVSLGRDETEQKFYIEPIKRRMNEALAQVRLAIAGQANTWEEFKKTMDNDLVEKTDETGVNLSQNLLASIQKNNVDALREKMAQLGNSLNRPMNSITSEIFAKATKNQQDNVKLEVQQAEARRKIAREHNYTGAVQQNMYDDFNQMGFANPTDFELADEESAERRKKHIIAMYEQARKQIANLYTVDVNNKEGRGLLMQVLFGDDPYALGFRIQSVLGNNVEDWRVFYNKLIQYSDEYTEAQKKTYDQAKKIAEQMWKVNQRNLANQETLRKMQQESSLFGKRTNMWSNLGLGNLTADPEVELMKMKMQMAEDYYAFVFKNSKNQQLIDEAERARQEAELAYANQMATAMKNRLLQMQQLVQPIETFGSEVGKAFAEMRNDVSSAQESIKNALKSMLESWANMALNDVNTQMWKAINDAGAKRGKKNAQPGIEAARANANANAVKEDFSNLGTEANPMYVRLVDEGASYLTQQPQPNFENLPPQQPSLGWNPDGTPINPNSPAIVPPYAPPATPEQANKQAEGSGAPRAWAHRNRDNVNAFYNDAATQTGAAAADAITGGGSFADAAAGITGSFIGGVMNTEFKKGGKSKEDKEKANQLKKEKKHQKELSKEVKKGNKDREKVTTQGVQNITNVTDAGNKEQTEGTKVALNAGMAMTQTALTTNLNATQENNEAITQSDADRTQAGMTFSIAGAIGKCFDFLGPIAGPIAAAGVMATLMGLLQWALNSAFSGSKKKSNTSSTNTKLVTGMLTYDSGNVQDLKPFVADNGEVYWAKEDDGKQMQGVKMLTSPTATTVNGQPSLVAERGPEIVIGRETTHAMMMNNPGLLKALVNYDRNYSGRNSVRRAFDNGNVGDVFAAGTQAGGGNLSSGASATDGLVSASIASNAALLQAVNALLQRLNKPINAKINMFGRGELYDSLNKANQFMKNK